MPQDSPSRHQDQFLVRLPDGLRDQIAESAKRNGRSMNAEIVQRIEASFAEDEATRSVFDITEKVGTKTILTIVNQTIDTLRKNGELPPKKGKR